MSEQGILYLQSSLSSEQPESLLEVESGTSAMQHDSKVKFIPPFREAKTEAILDELGLTNSRFDKWLSPIAHCVETGNYPKIVYLLGCCRERYMFLEDDPIVANALRRFQDCAELGLAFEAQHGKGSAKNHSHQFWIRQRFHEKFGLVYWTVHPGHPATRKDTKLSDLTAGTL